MNRRMRRRPRALGLAAMPGPERMPRAIPYRFATASPRALLLGTALASTLLITGIAAPAPAKAVTACTVGGAPVALPGSPNPIDLTGPEVAPINCENDVRRTGDATSDFAAINLETAGNANTIYLNNAGRLDTYNPGGDAYGIRTYAAGDDTTITIVNTGDIDEIRASGNNRDGYGIYAFSYGQRASISITNEGFIRVTADDGATGIYADTEGPDSSVTITNRGDMVIHSLNGGRTYGILGYGGDDRTPVRITNSGNLTVISDGTNEDAYGIFGYAVDNDSPVTITNRGNVTVRAEENAYGIFGEGNNPVTINNVATVNVRSTGNSAPAAAIGIGGETNYGGASITIVNRGPVKAVAVNEAYGLSAWAGGEDSPTMISNHGPLTVTSTEDNAYGIYAFSRDPNSTIAVTNTGDINVDAPQDAYGIATRTTDVDAGITLVNNGGINANSFSGKTGGIFATTFGASAKIAITNNGGIQSTAGHEAYGIQAVTRGQNAGITINNSGDIQATSSTQGAYGIHARSQEANSPIAITNTGSVFAQGPSNSIVAGIYMSSVSGATIVNAGEIGASSNLAITVQAGPIDIFNTGTITGFVLLDADDRFINQAGGVFEARQTSDFDAYGPGGGNDLFRNEAGGTVHATGDTRFVNLERFENQGLISMVDGDTGDSFTLSNTPGGTDLDFAASGNSTLAVDARLAGPNNSSSDTFTIEGDVSGVTTVQVNNTNGAPGVFNPEGIPVVFVTGATPNSGAFTMDPIDTGFFDYDLFFVPTGSGFWELRSFPGAGAYLLPQLVTAAQDIWHQSSSTWFDRTADLRVLLAGGAAPAAYDPGGKGLGAPGPYRLTPAVWARGSGGWLDRDDSASTTAYGRNYTFDLDRDLDTIDFQVGVDMGKRDFWSQGDALVFGLLGGFVHGDLDYDSLARNFDFDGAQVGAYATYLNGGLFVDTLLNVHLYELETATLGFPSSLDANTIGLRTDTGYRFGSFSGGPFIEPLATIEVTWADIDGFSLGGNTVSFDDDANVRGRLGLRAGTTMQAWEGTLMEPFVTGSLWGNLTDDNQATLVSTGRTFRFEDQLEDVWGEVSAGVNFFNFSQTTAVFAKLDVTFGDDLTGVGGKAGLRVNW